MTWGSQWAFATHAGINPICFCCCPKDQPLIENPGGTAFDKTPQGLNPFLRVKPPKPLLPLATVGASVSAQSELVYATESFDRRQPVTGSDTNSRWLAGRRGLQVPVLDDRLVVAFQKSLKFEEYEFLILIAAIEEDDCYH